MPTLLDYRICEKRERRRVKERERERIGRERREEGGRGRGGERESKSVFEVDQKLNGPAYFKIG